MCDLLWSDPYEEEGQESIEHLAERAVPGGGTSEGNEGRQQQQSTQWFGYNETRQCSYVYGVEAVKQFLKDNKLTSVIRAHEAQVDGYKMQMVNKGSGIPRVITIFSAPNYCDVYKNKAACLKFDNNVLNIKQFIDSPHPYYLPNFMDVFQWSLPFVAEKVTDMLANVLDYEDSGSESSDEDKEEKLKNEKKQAVEEVKPLPPPEPKGGMLKKKVLAVSKLLRVYKVLRQENEAIVQLKQLTPNHKVPFGLLRKGTAAIKEAVDGFDKAKEADMVNEGRPAPAKDTAIIKEKIKEKINKRVSISKGQGTVLVSSGSTSPTNSSSSSSSSSPSK